jgi:hypothetical protein
MDRATQSLIAKSIQRRWKTAWLLSWMEVVRPPFHVEISYRLAVLAMMMECPNEPPGLDVGGGPTGRV